MPMNINNLPFRNILAVILALMTLLVSACGDDEESGKELKLDEAYDSVRNGARLVLSYDAETNTFDGYVENTTDETLDGVRVEVHLSNGIELGPTRPIDLKPGERAAISLPATEADFTSWRAHPEVGGGEHGHGKGGEEHGEGGKSGHNEGGSD